MLKSLVNSRLLLLYHYWSLLSVAKFLNGPIKNFLIKFLTGSFEPNVPDYFYQMITKIKDHEQAYLHALVLANTAPDEARSQECIKMAESIGSRLTEKQRDLCRKGVEVCMELLK